MSLAGPAAAGPPPNEDGMLLLEGPFARVPHEELRRHLRTQQRHVERDLGFCTSTLDALSKASKGGPSSHPISSSPAMTSGDVSTGGADEQSFLGDVSFSSEGVAVLETSSTADDPEMQATQRRNDFDRSLDAMIGRVAGLKRKIANVHDLAGPALTRLDARTHHLGELQEMQSITLPAFEEWCRTRLDRMLVDWLLRKGHLDTGKMLAEKRKIEPLTELSLFAEIARIEASLLGKNEEGGEVRRSCAPSLAWCSENKAALRKIKSTLEFELRLQEFIELARDRSSVHDALAHARRHLLPYLTSADDDDEDRDQAEILRMAVSRAMGLLACGPSSYLYADMYAPTRWESLCKNFRRAALQIHSLPRQSTLQIALSAGLSSLKLPACYEETATAPPHLGGHAFGDDHIEGATSISAAPIVPSTEPIVATKSAHIQTLHNNCPVCDTRGLGFLAKEVPFSHCAHSSLLCRLSGKIMNESDPPMALPNGQVYALRALQELAASSDDGETIVCPTTGQNYSIRSLRKVFIS